MLTHSATPAVLLVDPVRHHEIANVKFDFWGWNSKDPDIYEVPCFLQRSRVDDRDPNTAVGGQRLSFEECCREERPMERLVSLLTQHGSNTSAAKDPARFIQYIIAKLIYQDLGNVMACVGRTLDEIELALSNNALLQSSMPMWREQLGAWRNVLFHQSILLGRLAKTLKARHHGTTTDSTFARQEGKLKSALNEMQRDMRKTSRRIETTFQALMSSINIVESERAIREAESISKLTQLAFFFIPLSLVSSAFGMNINVSAAHMISKPTPQLY